MAHTGQRELARHLTRTAHRDTGQAVVDDTPDHLAAFCIGHVKHAR